MVLHSVVWYIMVYMYIKNAAIVGVMLLLVSLLWVASRSQTESLTDPNN